MSEGARWLRVVLGLLVLILGSQVVLLILQYRSQPQELPRPARTPKEKQPTTADAGLKLQLALAEPEVRQVVEQLGQGIAESPSSSFLLMLDDVRVESATGIGEIIVSARLRTKPPRPVKEAVCRLELRDAQGALIYQTTGEVSDSGERIGSERIRFLIDNPPEFDRVEVALQRVEWASEK